MHNHKGEECPVHGKKECPAIEEAVRVPAKTGNIVNAYFRFRSNYISLKMFFPQTSVPNKADVQSQVEKVYPGARLLSFQVSILNQVNLSYILKIGKRSLVKTQKVD